MESVGKFVPGVRLGGAQFTTQSRLYETFGCSETSSVLETTRYEVVYPRKGMRNWISKSNPRQNKFRKVSIYEDVEN